MRRQRHSKVEANILQLRRRSKSRVQQVLVLNLVALDHVLYICPHYRFAPPMTRPFTTDPDGYHCHDDLLVPLRALNFSMVVLEVYLYQRHAQLI